MAKATIGIPIKRHSFLPLFRSPFSLSNTTHLARLRVGKATHPSVDGRQGKEQEEGCEHLEKKRNKKVSKTSQKRPTAQWCFVRIQEGTHLLPRVKMKKNPQKTELMQGL